MDKLNREVTNFLDAQNHPLRKEIEQLRHILLNSGNGLTETIKWNAPNYTFENRDRITMKIQPPRQVQLIFHRGAQKMEQPKARLITEPSGLLTWKENDRALASFRTLEEITELQSNLETIVTRWINATK